MRIATLLACTAFCASACSSALAADDDERRIVKEVVVPGRLVNFVVRS